METNKNFKGDFLGYLITIVTLLISTSPFFFAIAREAALIVILFLVIIAQVKGINIFAAKVFMVMGLIYALIIIQGIFWGFSVKAALYYPIYMVFLPFLVYSILGIKYFNYLFNVIYFSSIYTLVLWLAQSLSSDVDRYFQDLADIFYKYSWDKWPRSLIFYTTGQEYAINRQLGIYRNSGIFHEPGAYSIFLMIAILINTIIQRKPLHRKNIILSGILLTTFSTVGYIMLFIFAIYAVPKSKLPPIVKVGAFLLLIYLTVSTYNTSYFLREKIQQQYQTQVRAYSEGKVTRGRFYSALSSLRIALKYPISGRNILVSTEVQKEIGYGGSFGYGFIGLIAKFGLIFTVIYMYFLYIGIKKLCLIYDFDRKFVLIFYIILNLGLLTQAFILNMVIVTFFIVGLLFPKKLIYGYTQNVTHNRRYRLFR